jgi:MerR family transcriptional regulator/heat shock protein HspR
MLRMIQRLSQDEGINLEGIRRILAMERELETLRVQVAELARLLAAARQAPPSARVFTADEAGGVHMGHGLRRRTPRAITSR